MATAYQRGRAKEYAAISTLEKMGYNCLRAASSKGLYDIVGVRFDGTILVQVKLTSTGNFSEDENCEILRDLPVHPTTIKQLWVYESGRGLSEVRDLKEPKHDARTPDGKIKRAEAQERAKQIKRLIKKRKNAK